MNRYIKMGLVIEMESKIPSHTEGRQNIPNTKVNKLK